MNMQGTNPINTKALPLLFFIALLLGIENLYGRYFPNGFGLLGHDFALTNPALLDGAYWFWNNSILDVPWFTPSFCGGQPFFADPQSIYYSPLQWLAFFLTPTQASHAALLLASSMGYWSFYFLFRCVFQGSVQASIMAGALAMLNGFVPYRMIIGEVGYQPFLLTGFIAHALLSRNQWHPLARVQYGLGNIFWAGLGIALMLHAGLTTLMIPAALGVIVIALIAQLGYHGVSFASFFLRSIAACIFAGGICASKILASTTFMSHFPRDAYLLPGFPDIVDALRFPLYSLFLQSGTVWHMATPKIANAYWTIFPHEWAYQFGFVYLLLLLAGLYFSAGRSSGKKNQKTHSDDRIIQQHPAHRIVLYCVMIAAILLIPSAVLWYTPEWNAVLKSVPIIKTTSFPFRQIIIWIPLGCVAGAMAWQSAEKKICANNTARDAEAWLGLVLVIVAILLESSLADKSYYIDPSIQTYDPSAIDQAWQEARHGHIPPIGRITDYDQLQNSRNPNESIITGESFLHCYNPSYGYRQETLPVGRLKSGESVMFAHDSRLNIKNPACLVWPSENACTILGDEYKSVDIEAATSFVNRKPINFSTPKKQQQANLLSEVSIVATIIGILFSLISGFRRMKYSCRAFSRFTEKK